MAFEVINGFHETIQKTQASGPDRRALTFEEGLERAVKLIRDTGASSNKVVIIGNGGSAAIASHQAVDLWRNGGIRATAFNDAAMLTCIANDFGYKEVFTRPIDMFCDAGDLVIAISSSGQSENIVDAAILARKSRCRVFTLSGFDADNPLREAGELNFWVPSRSYGIVETAHLVLLHAIIDEVIRRKKGSHDVRANKKSVLSTTAHPPS